MILALCLASCKCSPFFVGTHKAVVNHKQRNNSLDSCNLGIHQRDLLPNILSPINDRNFSTLQYCAKIFAFVKIVRRLQYNNMT